MTNERPHAVPAKQALSRDELVYDGAECKDVDALIEQPLDTLECFPECPSYTEPILLHHPGTGITVECGPYPYALYSSMAAGYRTERQQCVAQYQRQGYVRLASTAGKSR